MISIFFQIFGHLPPIDILHLARTTKDLRRLCEHSVHSVSLYTENHYYSDAEKCYDSLEGVILPHPLPAQMS